MSQVRQNFHADCESAINKQINLELNSNYTYLSMAYNFDRDNVALRGFHEYFKKASNKKRESVEKLMKYQNKRGGRIVLRDIVKLPFESTPEHAVTAALGIEEDFYAALLDAHAIARTHKDADLSRFLETCLEQQVDAIKSIRDLLKKIHRVGSGLGIFVLDKEVAEMSW